MAAGIAPGLAPPASVHHQRNAVEQFAGFVGRKHGGLALFDDVFGTAHSMRRIHLDDLADHQPVEQHAQRGQVLLHRGRG